MLIALESKKKKKKEKKEKEKGVHYYNCLVAGYLKHKQAFTRITNKTIQEFKNKNVNHHRHLHSKM